MPWGDWSGRTADLPPDWDRRRRRQLRADGGRCTYVSPDTGLRCTARATDVHHRGDADDHDDLASLCSWHHDRITGAQGATSSRRPRERRPPEQHPGIDPRA
ncbi:MAG: hypothetical protein LBE67_12340 [Kocuria palustris]|nr:hypothetical protein [Kocuria palustris]